MPTYEDRFIAIGAKLEAVDACLSTLLNEHFSSCPCGITPDESLAFRRASTLAFVAADYLAQADELIWALENDVSAAVQTRRIDVAASVIISGSAIQRSAEMKETMTCSR